MTALTDSNILVRLADATDPQHPIARRAVDELRRRGWALQVCPQNLIEFRGAATRPKAVNGLGLTAAEAGAAQARFQAEFPLLPDTPDIFPRWEVLVASLGVIGKQVHDARLLAVCQAHQVDAVLTFNITHFRRLAAGVPGLAVLDPAAV